MNRVERALDRLGIVVQDKGLDRRAYGACPFHVELGKHDNWFIRLRGPRRGQYHCFVCKESGGLADLAMHRLGVELGPALEWLDAHGGPDEKPPTYEGVRMVLVDASERAFRWPREIRGGPLARWVTPARQYAERRHLTPDQVERWGLGYAVIGKLAGRLVIPVRDAHGVPCSYMARTYGAHETRYLYPSQRDSPDLDVVFGEQFWPPVEARDDKIVVVTEGALNALAVERAMEGEVSVVALGGSDVRMLPLAKVATFGTVVVFTDDDLAGGKAADALSWQLARHTRVRRVTVGEGRDADDVPRDELRDTLCRGIER